MDHVTCAEIRRWCAARPGGTANAVVRVRDSHRASRDGPGKRRGQGGRTTPLHPMVGQIKDPTLRDEYARSWLAGSGWDDVAQVIDRARGAAKRPRLPPAAPRLPCLPRGRAAFCRRGSRRARPSRPDPSRPNPVAAAIGPQSAVALPGASPARFSTRLTVESFTHPGYAAVRAAIEAAGGTSLGVTGGEWIDAVRQRTTSALTASLISELGVEAIAATRRRCPATSPGCWLVCRRSGWAGRSRR